MMLRPLVAALGALACGSAALANEVQLHICAAAQNLGQAYARTQYFNGETGPDQSAEVAANLANATAEIAAAEAGVQQPFSSSPGRQRSIAELQAKLAAYARNAEGRSPAARMSMIQGFYTHYRFALSLSYASNRPDDFRWDPTCDSQMLDANWHLGLAATYAAVRFDRGTVEETHARSAQGGANSSAFQAIRTGLRLALDGTGPAPLEHCFFNTEEAWSIVPMLPADEPWATYVDLLPRVLEVCRGAGPRGGLPGHRVTVPNVAGLTLADAKRRLTGAGLTVQLAPGSPARSAADTGKVETQSVTAGTRVATGTPVRLTVHSPYVPPPSDARAGTGDASSLTGKPAIQCPAEVSLARPRDSLPAGTRVPLLPARSGWTYRAPNGLYESFECWYGLGSLSDKLLEISFTQKGLGHWVAGCGNQDSTSLLGTRYLWSRTAMVNARAFAGMNSDLASRTAGDLMRQLEPHAEPCRGLGMPTPVPSPVPVVQIPTPVPAAPPPPAPPACPGPGVTVVYDLWNPPPYSGLGGIVCRDGAGGMWVNISNNVYRVTGLHRGAPDRATGCFTATRVVTPAHTYEGTLCPK